MVKNRAVPLILSFGLLSSLDVAAAKNNILPAGIIGASLWAGPVILATFGVSNFIDAIVHSVNADKKAEAQAELKKIEYAMSALNEQTSRETVEQINAMILNLSTTYPEVAGDSSYAGFKRSWNLIAQSYGVQSNVHATEVKKENAGANPEQPSVPELLGQQQQIQAAPFAMPDAALLLERIARLKEDQDVLSQANAKNIKELNEKSISSAKWGAAQLATLGVAAYIISKN